VITGGTGTLGSAIVKEQEFLRSHGISKIRVISRDEQKQVYLQRTYEGSIPLDCYLGDVTDLERMRFAIRDAHFIIHSAALKHVEKLESDVKTGFKTNFLGTQNVADAFQESKSAVSGIFVSTDKAAAPITAYGVSKLAAEHLWLWNNTFQKNIRFGVTRWGNVFGSKGSVIETWTRLAKEGKPLPITDLNCTRFFMMIEDAAQFIIKGLVNNNCGLSYPEMKSAEMIEILKMIWHYWNPDKEALFNVLGMRSIEKLHEVMLTDGKSSHDVERFTKEELKQMYEVWLGKSGD